MKLLPSPGHYRPAGDGGEQRLPVSVVSIKVFQFSEDFRGKVNVLFQQLPDQLLPAFFPAFLSALLAALLSAFFPAFLDIFLSLRQCPEHSA